MTSYRITSEYIGDSAPATLEEIRAIVADWTNSDAWASPEMDGWTFEVRQHGDEIRVYASNQDDEAEPGVFRDWTRAGSDYYTVVAERITQRDEIHAAARERLAAALGVSAAILTATLSQIGLRHAIDADGRIMLQPSRRLDTINHDAVTPVYQWMSREYQLYIEALSSEADESVMTDAYKLDALLLHQSFMLWSFDPMHNTVPLALVYERDAETRIRDAGYLHRLGYRVYESHPYPEYHSHDMPDDREWIYTDEAFRYATADKSTRYFVARGLYRVETVATQTTALSDVLTLAEASELYQVDATTIRVSIHKGYVAGRKSGGTWLIARADADKRWRRRE